MTTNPALASTLSTIASAGVLAFGLGAAVVGSIILVSALLTFDSGDVPTNLIPLLIGHLGGLMLSILGFQFFDRKSSR